MRLFGFKKKKGDILDLSEKFEKSQEKTSRIKENETSSEEGFNFLGSLANSVKSQNQNTQNSDYVEISEVEDKKRRLSKRLLDMTNKIEELSNQIYHLQQRIEVLEQKLRVGNFG
jgi:predicted  nucleic acid-binding Zn-ribbon protein